MENDAKKNIAVLLTVHNRKEQTIASLDKLYAQNIACQVKVDVYMVDDGCTDGTAQAVERQFPKTYIVQGNGMLYWNRGMWTAWRTATERGDYDYYLWLNDDTELFPYAVEKMLTMSIGYENRAIIIGATRNNAGDKLTYGGRINGQIAPCDGAPYEVDQFNGNIVLIPQSVYAILGNLDYFYTHSKGDFDYGIRAQKAGIKMYQCGDALGVCEAHEHIDDWCNPNIPFRRRWQLMHRPNGMPPRETFHLEKQINVAKAVFHFFTVYLRCAFPTLWLK